MPEHVSTDTTQDRERAHVPQAGEILTEQQAARLQELDRTAKMLVRRDLELAQLREKREEELQELRAKTTELERMRAALLNMLEDTEEARAFAEQERNRSRAIINSFPDCLLVLNVDGKLELLNPRATELFGVTEEEVLGKSFAELEYVESLQPLRNLIAECEGVIDRIELPLEDESVWEVSTISLSYEGAYRGMIVAMHDITRKKEVERLKTEFVSLAAHQLRTPLSAIKWTFRLILEGDVGEVNEQQRELLQKGYRSNERMIMLIDDLLDVTRIEEGRYVYDPTREHLEEIAGKVVASYEEDAKEEGVTIEYNTPEESLPRVSVDVEKIRVAFQNLIDNAVRYTPKEGTVTVSVRVREDEAMLEACVADQGVGIPKEQQPRVFEKFFRAENAKRIDTEGTGLGLYIVKNIVEAHGGSIWFETEEGEGTRFFFTIPVAETEEEEA